jgi:tetratricopeptide (TPR) repeat protein
MRLLVAILTLAVVFATGCATSKGFAKRGAKLEQAGMFEEAAGMYFTALQKKRSNIDAQIGMRNTGQLVLNKRLQEFVQQKTMGKKRDAISAWQAAESYQKRVQSLGVGLTIPDFYLSDYETVKQEYIDEIYEQGLDLMDSGEYKQAEQLFSEIARLDPNHNEAGDLAAVAYAEPLYKQATTAFNSERYREAYEKYELVRKRIPGYKDTEAKITQSLERGLFTIALLPFENGSGVTGLDTRMNAYALEAMTSVDDPFLRVVDRGNMELILEEQKLALSGIFNQETAASVGQMLGAQALLTGTVISYSTDRGSPQRFSRDGFERYQVKMLNAEGKEYFETRYNKVTYNEFVRQNRASVKVQFRVISLSTGEILQSKTIERDMVDAARWAEYGGATDNLFPARGSNVSLNRAERNSMMALFSANREPQAPDKLTNGAFQQVTGEMKNEISALVKQIVK